MCAASQSLLQLEKMQLKLTDSDCSDREYHGETGHLTARLLNGEADLSGG